MGRASKRSKKESDSDEESDFDDDVDSQDLTMDQNEEEDDGNGEFESEDEDTNEEVDDDNGESESEDEDKNEEEDYDNGGFESEDEDKNEEEEEDELDELEKEYMELRDQQRGIFSELKRHKDEDILKGQAVKNQKALWDKTLEFRFLLQKPFSSSNRLPQEPIRSSFCESDESVSAAYSDLITSSKKTLDSLVELEEALLEKNPAILQEADGKSERHSDAKNDEDWSKISQMHGRIASFRDKSIDKWQRKSQVATGAAAIKGKLHAFNQNISEQVSTYMRDPSRMVKQMQLRRSTVGVFGAAQDVEAIRNGEEPKSDGVVAQADGDPELIDDSEFYQQLLKEFFESVDPTSNETAMYALKRFQTKKRKLVDRRASKGRKIRYHVHEKIINFMSRQPPPNNITSTLGSFNNLFRSMTKNGVAR